MGKQLERIEKKIEHLEPGRVVQLEALLKGIKLNGQNDPIVEATIMLLSKYGIEWR